MNACKFSLSGMDVGACVASWFGGLLPDWLVPLLPFWWVVALIAGVGIAYRFAGVPGVAAFGGVVGFILGRRSMEPRHEHVDGKDAEPPVRTGKLKPIFKRK